MKKSRINTFLHNDTYKIVLIAKISFRSYLREGYGTVYHFNVVQTSFPSSPSFSPGKVSKLARKVKQQLGKDMVLLPYNCMAYIYVMCSTPAPHPAPTSNLCTLVPRLPRVTIEGYNIIQSASINLSSFIHYFGFRYDILRVQRRICSCYP